MGKTKEGQDVLKTIWRLQQTEPDEAAIAAFAERSVSE